MSKPTTTRVRVICRQAFVPGEQLVDEIRVSGLDAVLDGILDHVQQVAVRGG